MDGCMPGWTLSQMDTLCLNSLYNKNFFIFIYSDMFFSHMNSFQSFTQEQTGLIVVI